MIHVVTERDTIAALLESSTTPEARLQAAIHWCRANDVHILPFHDHGVLRGHLSGEWTVDQRRDPVTGSQRDVIGVSLTGAALVAFQPRADRHDEHSAIAARAIGTSLPWMVGVDDAFTGETQAAFWIKGRQGRLYVSGFEEGQRVRESLTIKCACNHRRMYFETTCTSCDEQRFVEEESSQWAE